MDRIAVLIPCYNEELSIKQVVEDSIKAFPEAVVYVYDNNSTDRTAEIAEAAGAVVRHEYQQGKGNVIRRMFREIDAECYIMVDGDNTYEMSDAPKLAELVLHHNADMVVGDRLSSTYFSENDRPFHNFGNSLVRSSINRLFGCEICDIMTGFRAFSYQFVKTFPVISKGFEIETEMTIHAVSNNMQVENVVIGYRDREVGSESKLNTFSDGAKVLLMIAKLFREYKPFAFFNIFAIVLAALSAVFMVPVLVDFAKTGLVEKFPTLIVCGFAFMAALQSFFAGLILDNIVQRDRQSFEIELNRVHGEFELAKKSPKL